MLGLLGFRAKGCTAKALGLPDLRGFGAARFPGFGVQGFRV